MVVQPAALALCCCTTSAALLIGWRLGRRGLAARAGATALAPGVEGRLYNYRPSGSFNALQAFESPASHGFTKYVVYVGGLTDGLLACPYVPALGEACQRVGWALVQPLLSSSYIGYGTGSLDRDADELSLLLGFLAAERGATAVALVGHSTGCQDAVHLIRVAPPSVTALVRLLVLQAPVSDREGVGSEGGEEGRLAAAALLARAESLVAVGRADEILTMHHGVVPITAGRYASLLGRDGPDDLFSSDLSEAQLKQRLGHLRGTRTVFAHSLDDEYVPRDLDTPALAARLVAAAGGDLATGGTASILLLRGARHNLLPAVPGEEPARVFVEAVEAALLQCHG